MMDEIRLVGLPNCDSTRKARKDLEAAGMSFRFRDLRADPLAADEIAPLLAALGEGLLNRSSTTWRGLSAEEKQHDPAALLLAHPTLMKRPVLTCEGRMTMGWSPATAAIWLAAG